MSLLLRNFPVHEVRPADHHALHDGILNVSGPELSRFLSEADPRIARVDVDFVTPGESTRIVCVKDIIEPRLKTAGSEPGLGTVHALSNCAVVTCGPIVGFQEGIIDADSPGSQYSPFDATHLIVLQIHVVDGLSPHEHEETVRQAGLRATDSLAELTIDLAPDSERDISWSDADVDSSLPRIAYVYMVLSQGLLHDTYVLGQNAQQDLPQIVDPRLVFENGIVSGNCVSACDKNTTWHHQHNPVISRLLDGHGKDWNFVGVVVTNEPTRLNLKEQSAQEAIQLVQELQAEGVIITKEGFGNPDADLMMLLRGLEQAGIRTVAVTDEYAGVDGASQSLADTTPEADAVVSTGNANELIVLPPVSRTIGPLPDVSRLAGGYPHSLRSDGSIEVELQALIGATNQLGYGTLTCRTI